MFKLFKITAFLVLGHMSVNLWGASGLGHGYDSDSDWADRLAGGKISGKVISGKPLSQSERKTRWRDALVQRARNHEKLMLAVKIAGVTKELVRTLPVEIRKEMMLRDAMLSEASINKWITYRP